MIWILITALVDVDTFVFRSIGFSTILSCTLSLKLSKYRVPQSRIQKGASDYEGFTWYLKCICFKNFCIVKAEIEIFYIILWRCIFKKNSWNLRPIVGKIIHIHEIFYISSHFQIVNTWYINLSSLKND